MSSDQFVRGPAAADGVHKLLPWYGAGALAAIAIGYASAALQIFGIAPIGLLSLSVGCGLGAILGWLAVRCGVACPTRLVVGTIALAVLTVLAEHAWLYRDFRRQWHEARANSAQVALFRPETPWSPAEYFAREATPDRLALWALDAVLIASAAVAMAIVVRRYFARKSVASAAAKSPSLNPEP